MNWLFQNYKWIFSGIGVSTFGLVGFLFRRRMRPRSVEVTSISNAPNVKTSNSNLASGGNVSQELNAPIIHHAENVNIGSSAPREINREDKAAPKGNEHNNNLAFCCAETVWLEEVGNGFFVPRNPRGSNTVAAALLKFSNDAAKGTITRAAAVKATVIYRDGVEERLRVTGGWVEHDSGIIRFNVDDSHELIVAFVHRDELCTLNKRDQIAHGRRWWLSELHRLGEVTTMNILVRLTDPSSGYCFLEEEFEIVRNALTILAIKSASVSAPSPSGG